MNNTKIAKLTPGDGTLTRRVKRRCKEIGFEVKEDRQWNGYGCEIVAYHVPADILAEEESRRDAELQEKAEVARKKREKAEAEARERQINDLLQKFPKLTRKRLEELPVHVSLKLPDEVGYQIGYGTKHYWESLGYRVTGEPSAYLVQGARLIPLFWKRALVEKRRRNPEKLWRKWCEEKGTDIALAEAVRFANRLQKVKRHPTFYSLKDEWIRRNQVNLVEGRRSRKETRTCWGCDGEGMNWYGDECDRCDGTGIYSQRTLYEHEFSIEGKSYVFHSYVKPKSVSNTPGSDQAVYGRPFAANELPLPPQSTLVAMVELALSRPT